MVQGGTVSVRVRQGGNSYDLSRYISVTARNNWQFATVNPAQQSAGYTCGNGYILSFSSPPAPGQRIGACCLVLAWSFTRAPAISDNGPNHGYLYVATGSPTFGNAHTEFSWALHQDLANASSTFSLAQCGNYNPQTQTGFISRANLVAGTERHEAGSANSHWAQYSAANSGANNIGVVLEAQIAPPGTSTEVFWISIWNSAQTASNSTIAPHSPSSRVRQITTPRARSSTAQSITTPISLANEVVI